MCGGKGFSHITLLGAAHHPGKPRQELERNLEAEFKAKTEDDAASWLALHGSLNLLSPNNLPRDDSTHTLVPYRFAMDQSDGCNSSFGFSIPRSFQFVST